MKLYVFDDARASRWAPFALTRPISELRYGSLLLRERLERAAGRAADGLLPGRRWLRDFSEAGSPGTLEPDDLPRDQPRLLLSSRFVPEGRIEVGDPTDRSVRLTCGDETVGCVLAPEAVNPDPSALAEPDELPGGPGARSLDGHVLAEPWDLVTGLPDRLRRDLVAQASEIGGSPLPSHVSVVGDGPVLLGPEVRLEPGVVLDTRTGPVRLDRGVEVLAGARLEGPLHAGPFSRLLGGSLTAVAAGPFSYLRGEVEETAVLGYSNKSHGGFLGHSLVGRWVNLGAFTTNSDLKNNYGPIRIGGPEGLRETGMLKLGCLLGDHVKTAIGTLLNTGSVVGAGANVFGDSMPPKWVPPFAWGTGEGRARYRKEDFLETALQVMRRRDVEPSEEVARWLGAVYDEALRREAE